MYRVLDMPSCLKTTQGSRKEARPAVPDMGTEELIVINQFYNVLKYHMLRIMQMNLIK